MLKILGKDIFFLNLLFPKSLTFSYSNSVFLSPFFDHSLFHELNKMKKCMVGGGGGGCNRGPDDYNLRSRDFWIRI